jgi:uncharacterized membrane protein YfcA
MEMDLAGWLVTGFAILITGISKSGLGGALGGLAVPFMSMWMSPRDAVAVMLPVLITMDMVGIRAWRGKADWQDLRTLIPGALVGIALGTLAFGVMSDRVVKGAIGLIAVGFAVQRLLGKGRPPASEARRRGRSAGCGGGVGLHQHPGPRRCAAGDDLPAVPPPAARDLRGHLGVLLCGDQPGQAAVLHRAGPVHPRDAGDVGAVHSAGAGGVWSGMRILKHIPERPFYLFATAALGLSGVKLLWDGVMG